MTIAETINYCSLSSPQQSIWFDQLRHADTPLYNIGGYVQIDGVVDPILFEKAINQVIQENEALRTVFGEGSVLPVQFFDSVPDIELEYHDLSAQDESHQQAMKWMDGEISTPFQLYGQFLFKFALLKISEKCHYWFVKYHHLIMDGWGNSLIFQRVAEIYTALQTGSAIEEKARYSYLHFVQDDQAYLESSAYQRHKAYWQEKYRDLPEPLIPHRYATQFKGIVPSHRQTLTLKWTFYQQLIAFAKDHNVSTFHLILGVLYCYFTRTHDRQEFVIGLPVLNRNKAAFKQTVGLFTSVLPARFPFGTSLNFIELVQAISTELRKDYRHQRFPVDEINKLAGLHHAGQKSLFDITLSYQKHDYLKTFAGNSAKFVTLPNCFEQMALAIAVEEYWENQDIRVTFDYNLAAFDDAEIELFGARFKHLLHEILEHPTIPLWQLNLMPAAERHKVLVEFNDTTTPYPVDKTLVDLFEEQVRQTPNNVAVVFEEQKLTYQELNERANQLARFLQMLGVKPEILVGICVERSLDMMIGLLGILKAGGAYLPLDPNYPSERLAFMLDNSKAPVLLTQQKLITSIASALSRADMIQIICLDKDRKIFSNMSTANLAIRIQPDNLAYIIYTSGSTGKPKGVMVEHHGLCNLAQAQIQSFHVQSDSRVLQFASISFDASVSETIMALGSGATLCLGNSESLQPGPALVEYLKKQTITHVTLPPVALAVLPTTKLPHLQCIIIAGEAGSPNLAAQWSQERHFFNAYGPTESTVCATVFEYTEGLTLPIGSPIANTQIYLLDAHLQPVPIYTPGELYIGGVGIARGYLNRTGLTQEKFIPNPFSKKHGSRLYKTGDLARYLPDGHIEYLGRIDHQVKVRGFRIELGEIEALLSQHPYVQETTVIVREDQPSDKRIVAYFVSDLIPKRIPYQHECLVKVDGQTLKLNTKDISRQGVCLQQKKTALLQEGHEIRLRFLEPASSEKRSESDEDSFWLKGKIVWVRTSWVGVELLLTSREQVKMDQYFQYLLEQEGLLDVVQRLLVGDLRHCLEEQLPKYMVPSHFVLLSALPLTPNGKIDRAALPVPNTSPGLSRSLDKKHLPQTEWENLIAEIWQEVLKIEQVGIHDHFFEIGGHSLLVAQVQAKLKEKLDIDIPMVELFEHPTVHSLAKHISHNNWDLILEQPQPAKREPDRQTTGDIAIIGIATRLPGAKHVEEFWQNLQSGVESIVFFEDTELNVSGIDTTTLNSPNYVKAGGVLSNIDCFDAAFFDYSPKEAKSMDPQHRLFLECAWEALENAGIEPGTDENTIGVYAGVGMNTYLLNNLYPNRQASDMAESYQLMIGNSNDFLTSRVSYKLNLKGPSVNIQTACSTSLVAVHSACKRLLEGECNVALAGGVSIRVPQKTGYLYQEGMIMSPDGHCRAFDANAQGTVVSNGLGIVVLKKLEDAQADGDHIYAVIKGSAINNDGAIKVGYTAPSVEGQAKVISEAQTIAGVSPETISYIETHGTGTKLGDPIEMAALNKAFRTKTQNNGLCAIGSVKTNIGHTDTAAGVTGLIKTSLALKHQALPPSLHFEQANPQIDFANSPFYVNTELTEWKKINGTPRRAGVSSFGIGGTNAHVILEEAPELEPSGDSRSSQLLVLSAKTDSALETATANLANYLEQNPEVNLADVAYTLSKGRKAFSYRRAVICQNVDEAITSLRIPNLSLSSNEQGERPVVFMFSGQGTQYVNMGLELYQTEPKFKEVVDECAEYLQPLLGLDLREILYPELEISPNPSLTKEKTPEASISSLSKGKTTEESLPYCSSLSKGKTGREIPPNFPLTKEGIAKENIDDPQQQINQTAIAQPALFVIEYALAKLWMSWGIYPEAMIGHSIGEYVAACISGVLSLENALTLVATRGKLMQQIAPGAMLAVPLSAQNIEDRLGEELSLAAINTPSLCVVSGPTTAVNTLQHKLTKEGVECTRLHTSHAFHSKMMEPILGAFTEQVEQLGRCTPQIPYLSNVTGTWMTAEESVTSEYWAEHLRRTVRFSEGVQQLLKKPERIFLEIGPGRTLSSIAKRHPKMANQIVLSSLRHPQESQADVRFLLNTLGQLWQTEISVNWSKFYANERRYRVPLPTYPFERQRYWIESSKSGEIKTIEPISDSAKTTTTIKPVSVEKKSAITDWFYQPVWKEAPSALSVDFTQVSSLWLVFMDVEGVSFQLVQQLKLAGQKVITVNQGTEFSKVGESDYMLNPHHPNDYQTLVEKLRFQNQIPQKIVHLWNMTSDGHLETMDRLESTQAIGYDSLLFLAQALGQQNVTDTLEIAVISNNMQTVTTDEAECYPEKAILLGPVKVIGQEYPNLTYR
jgi:amino acid adenylation domain-containing protein